MVWESIVLVCLVVVWGPDACAALASAQGRTAVQWLANTAVLISAAFGKASLIAQG